MKKILTVSLFAVMAVSAAHAKIASVEYVEGASVLGLTDGQTVQSQLNAAVVPAVKALQGRVEQISQGTGLSLGTDAVDTANIVDGAVTLDKVHQDVKDSIADAKKAGTDASTALSNHITTANTTFETKADAASKLAEAKQYADQAEADAISTANAYADQAEADAISTANAYTDAKIGDLGESANVVAYVDAVKDTVGDATTAINGVTANLNAEIARAQAAEAKTLTDAKTYADSLAPNYDAAGSAATAESNAKAYADSLAPNYDAAGSAATAESNAKTYADQAEADAVAAADTAAKAMIDLTNALTECAQKQCALTIENGSIKWEEVQK